MQEQIAAICNNILRREERRLWGLPDEDGAPRSLSWAEVTGSALRAVAVIVANSHGHAMSEYAMVAAGTPEEGLASICTHDCCSCLIYHPKGADTVTVAYIDKPCPQWPLGAAR